MAPKCDISGCEKEMAVMHAISSRSDGALFLNLVSGRSYFVCNECIEKLGLKDVRKR
jgi:hypothetical protein